MRNERQIDIPEFDTPEKADFYRRLRKKVAGWKAASGEGARWREFVLLAPDFFYLLCQLTMEPSVPAKSKAKLALAIAYFISPIDLLPEAFLGPIGYLDDICLAAFALNSLLETTSPDVLRRHWPGEEDVCKTIQRVLKTGDALIGKGLWRHLKRAWETNRHQPDRLNKPGETSSVGGGNEW